jgi:hypothetical protein
MAPKPQTHYCGDMKIDETRVAEALRATFDPRSDRALFASDAREILGMLGRNESREALIQQLAKTQLRISNMVVHDDCAQLADKLLEAANASAVLKARNAPPMV